MNIVFLDVNGVIDSFKHNDEMRRYNNDNNYENHYFDWNCLENLSFLVNATDANIVISSEWKEYKSNMIRLLAALKVYDLDKRVIGKTKRIIENKNGFTHVNRGLEIKDYLDNHEHDNFVILDDISWDLDMFSDHLILTHPSFGLTKEDAFKAINILKKNNLVK